MKKVLAPLFSLIFFFAIYNVVNAATVAIEPSHFEIKGKPGNGINGTFKFSADTGSTYQFSIRQFEADGTQGLIKLLPETPNYPVTKWVQFFPPITKATSAEDQTIGFRINVPETIEEQDFYFAILASPISPEADPKKSSATIQPSVASNIILSLFDKKKIEGDIKISLTGEKIQQIDNLNLSLTVQNNLNKFQTIEGSIVLTSIVDNKNQKIIPIIPQNILAGAVRQMTTTLEKNIPPAIYISDINPGIYKVSSTVSGDNGIKYTSQEFTIYIVPSLGYVAYPLITTLLLLTAVILSIKVFKKSKKPIDN